MRRPKRIRRTPGSCLLLLAGLVAGVIGVTPVSAAPASSSASYAGASVSLRLLARAPSFRALAPVAASSAARVRTARQHRVSNATGTGAGAPAVAGSATSGASPAGTAAPQVLHNFAGLTDAQQAAVYTGEVTPPDQGLCVGPDPTRANAVSVFGMVNVALLETDRSGTAVGAPMGLTTFFGDPNAFSDPRCFYDATTHTFFFTIISCLVCGPPGTADSRVDVAVLNSTGFAVYQGDTSMGGTAFGDQPHVGYDNNNLYISTDEFGSTTYLGALLFAVDKAALVAEGPVSAAAFGPLSLAGNPVITLQPAVSPGSNTGYLLNSFPYDQFGNSNSISNSLGFWTLKGGTLTGKVITSETYAFPVPAASTGNGSVAIVNGTPVQSEQFLNPDDSRMQQVQLQGGHLWASLPSAVLISGDTSARDGVAWFELTPGKGKILNQGYIAKAGSYLLYPAIWATGNQVSVSYTATSPTLNPSAAYSTFSPWTSGSPAVKIASMGTGPHLSFAGPLFARPRWGDYSAAAADPSGHGVWLATELIPTPPSGTYDNWGTQIWEISSGS